MGKEAYFCFFSDSLGQRNRCASRRFVSMAAIIIFLQYPRQIFSLRSCFDSFYINGQKALHIILLGHRITLHFDLHRVRQGCFPCYYTRFKLSIRLFLSLHKLPRTFDLLNLIFFVVVELDFFAFLVPIDPSCNMEFVANLFGLLLDIV